MALDMAKYRRLFLEEAAEHLSEISGALLALEKDPEAAASIDVIFRMAHSIKSMAASLGYDSITELAHVLEDRMEGVRTRGQVADGAETDALFRSRLERPSATSHSRTVVVVYRRGPKHQGARWEF